MLSHPVGAAVSVLATSPPRAGRSLLLEDHFCWKIIFAGRLLLLEDEILETRNDYSNESKKQIFIEIVNRERDDM